VFAATGERIVLPDYMRALISGLREALSRRIPRNAKPRRRSTRYNCALAALPAKSIRIGINWLFNDG
jgi:hypothetical protein